MAICSSDYYEACALCDCLNRHLTNFVHQFLEPGDTFIEGGGNVGQFTLLAAKKIGPSGNVLVYEPNPTVASRLKIACDLNGYNWVSVRQAALGDRNCAVPFFVADNSQLSSLFELPRLGPYGKTCCDMVRLDDDLLQFGIHLEQVALLKLDLEGGEWEALQGMPTLLSVPSSAAFLVELNTLCRPDGRRVVEQVAGLFRS